VERSGFVVLLPDERPLDPRVYGDLVAARTGLTKLEARLAVRKGCGILLEGLPEDAARAIVEALAARGIAARGLPVSALPLLPPPQRVVAIEEADGLPLFRAASGESLAVPWEAFGLVHAGAVVQQEYRQYFENLPFTGMPSFASLEGGERDVLRENMILRMETPPPDRRLSSERRAESVFHDADARFRGKLRVLGDLVTEDLGTRLRVAMDEISWGSEPDRFGGPAAMKRLSERLRAVAPGAFTPAALRLLSASDIREQVFPDIESYSRSVVWSAWKGIAWPSAGSSSPSPEPPAPPTDAGSSNASPGPDSAST
jgi:hypothetical protein